MSGIHRRRIRSNRCVNAPAALLPVAEISGGTFKVATKELPINAEQGGIPQPLSKNLDQGVNLSGFIFDVSLSTAQPFRKAQT